MIGVGVGRREGVFQGKWGDGQAGQQKQVGLSCVRKDGQQLKQAERGQNSALGREKWHDQDLGTLESYQGRETVSGKHFCISYNPQVYIGLKKKRKRMNKCKVCENE